MTEEQPKVKRPYKRKPWVYQSTHSKLQKKYKWLKWLALAGWLAFAISLGSCSSVKINGVKIKDDTAAKMDDKTSFYMLTSFWVSFAVANHFISRK